MKLVIAAEIFPPDIGGPATYTVKLAEALTDKGWEVSVVCYSDKQQDDDYKYKIHRVTRWPFKFHYLNYYKILKNLAVDADVIYAMGPVSSGRPALKVAKKLNKKLIVKVVGDYAWEQAKGLNKTNLLLDNFQQEKFLGKIGVLQKIEREVCRKADKVIVPSMYLKNIVSGWGVPENKIEIIYNSFSETMIENQKSFDAKTIVSSGRLTTWKGFEVLIEVVKDLKSEGDYKLIIFGDGPEFNNLIKLVDQLGLKGNVSIVGRVDRDELLVGLQSGIFVLNSGYEGLSHTILEAMAVGAPIIASRVGGNPELITDNDNGLLVEYNNKDQIKEAILKISKSDELRYRFINNSKEKLKTFTFDNMINNTINVLIK